jgi:Ca-activated chloride channel family protein
MAEPLSFDALASRECVPSAENSSCVLLKQSRRAAAARAAVRDCPEPGPRIDRSGSMYDEWRLEFVIEAVKFLAENVAPEDKVAIVAFADRAKVIVGSEEIHDKGAVRRAIEDIDLLEIGGGTQMALGMRAAIDEVKKNLAPNRLNRVLVLTDGQTYEETACIDLANQNRDQMSFSAMGVGVEFNEKLLMRIAQDSHGKYHFIGNPSEIPGIFEDELAGLRAVSVRNGRIEVTLAQGVQVREAFRASPKSTRWARPLVGDDRHISYESAAT